MRSLESAPTQAPTPENIEDQFRTLDEASGESGLNTDSEISMSEFEAEYGENTATTDFNSEPGSEAETAPAATPDVYSKAASTLRAGTERIAAILDRLSAGKEARQEARAEKKEQAKEVIGKVGRSALRSVLVAGKFTASMKVLTVEYATETGAQIRGKITEIAAQAQVRFAERAAYREDARRTQENTRRDQEDAFASYEPNIEATQNREEQERIDAQEQARADAEELAMLEEAEQDNKDFDANRAREQADRMREDEVKREIARYKAELQAKRLAAYERRARRRELYKNVRNKGGELYQNAKKGFKRFGKAALKVLKRGAMAAGAAATGAVQAARDSLAQTA